MLSKSITVSIIVIVTLTVSFGFLGYEQSKSPQITKQTLADLLNEDNFEKFNELQKDRYNELRYVNTH